MDSFEWKVAAAEHRVAVSLAVLRRATEELAQEQVLSLPAVRQIGGDLDGCGSDGRARTESCADSGGSTSHHECPA